MRTAAERTRVLELVAAGNNDCEISRVTGIPRRTVLDWRHDRRAQPRERKPRGACLRCADGGHDFSAFGSDYAYLLGAYLGDGHIVRPDRRRVAVDEPVDRVRGQARLGRAARRVHRPQALR